MRSLGVDLLFSTFAILHCLRSLLVKAFSRGALREQPPLGSERRTGPWPASPRLACTLLLSRVTLRLCTCDHLVSIV